MDALLKFRTLVHVHRCACVHWQALQHVYARSIDPGEVRPELNHASNAAAVIGRRELTKGGSLERRVFLPSYVILPCTLAPFMCERNEMREFVIVCIRV